MKRLFTATGVLVPTPEEAAAQTEAERQRIDRLLAKLRAAGVDPDRLS